ncbi:metal ABC transporter permease [Varibaculum prostatecancerukia]|uniref:metal ABC transporter permease n=1 Tax=Varibaculum prostatecancerukia TaxID=2811781 RepID=UPI001C003A3D|nr:metal ABC transporter permease [Varibaculum prostatecancerukia]
MIITVTSTPLSVATISPQPSLGLSSTFVGSLPSFEADWNSLLASPFFLRSLIVAVLVGLSAPIIGTYLVQRRLSLLGDGIGHVALTGVALGWVVGNLTEVAGGDALAVPGAVIASIVGAVIIELVRAKGGASGDVAMALLFYGGIASGVLVISLAGGTTNQLNSYLFGSIAAVSWSDVYLTIALSVLILVFGLGLRRELFSICNDEEFALASGIPVRLLTICLAVVSALTVSTAMRVVGVLLVSALMIVPVAISQIYARSFSSTMGWAMALGVVMCIAGLVFSYFTAAASGSAIVMGLITLYALAAALRPLVYRRHLRTPQEIANCEHH